MGKMTKNIVWLIILLFMAMLLGLCAPAVAQNTNSPDELFSDAPDSADLRAKLDNNLTEVTVVRARSVQVNLDHLATDGSARGADVIILNLFDDVWLPAVKERLERRSAASYTWFGSIEGENNSHVIMVVENGEMSANITVGHEVYQVRYAGNGIQFIREIDQSAFDDCAPGTPIDAPAQKAPLVPLDQAAQADDGSIIDVLVVYTADASVSPGINTEIQLAIDETNTSYANSGITQRVSLVHSEQVTYAESGDIRLDRDRLRAPADGYMDGVHTLRDTHCADVVVLWVNNGGGYCGIAYIMTKVSSAFESSAFCVVKRSCATGNYSFGHELGHLMSARHDWYVDSTHNSPYKYNHGYSCCASNVRTVMAYNNYCTDHCNSCTRIPYWSNPATSYLSCTLGSSIEDNHATLNNTALTVANFRDSTSCGIGCQDPPCTPGGDEYCSTDVPKAIVDLTTITSTVNILDSGVIDNMNVKLNITHTYDSDLDVFLISPGGIRVELFTDVGSGGDYFECTVLDDEAATLITSGTAPFTDCYQPEGSLADYIGTELAGTWTLEITDDAGGDTGTLDSWCLIVETCLPPLIPFSPEPHNGRNEVPLDTTFLSWNGSAELLLLADFNDKGIDAPIGTGGAGVGEPVFVSSSVTAIVHDEPMNTLCLEISDNSTTTAGSARFGFLDGAEITEGKLAIYAQLWFELFDNYYIYVRELGSSAKSFLNLTFHENGDVWYQDADTPSGGYVATYEIGRVIPVRIEFDFIAGIYDVWLDGELVVDDETHGITDRGVGAVLFGALYDSNLDGQFNLDNLMVTHLAPECQLTYDVYLGIYPGAMTLICPDVIGNDCDPNLSECGREYFWKVVAKNSCSETKSPIWSFTTVSLLGDFDWDCDADLRDFAVIAYQWQQVPGVPSADIAPPGGDNFIDMQDVAVFVDNWLDDIVP